MKFSKAIKITVVILIIFTFILCTFSCTLVNLNNENNQNTDSRTDGSLLSSGTDLFTEPGQTSDSVTTADIVPTDDETQTELTLTSIYKVKLISENDSYKTLEMYVHYNFPAEMRQMRRITFEIPADWHYSDSSVFGLKHDDDTYALKVDMWSIYNASRESVLEEFHTIDPELEDIFSDEEIYMTDKYEIFYRKYEDHAEIRVFYLYTPEKYFVMSAYTFQNIPGREEMFKKIVESVVFDSEI